VDETPADSGPWDAFGTYLRGQRQLAQLSLRQLADLTKVSNPYLSQIERGLHQPSIAIIKSLAEALNLSTSDLLAQAADIASEEQPTSSTEGAIRNDPLLNEAQRNALLAVYRSMVDAAPDAGAPSPEATTNGATTNGATTKGATAARQTPPPSAEDGEPSPPAGAPPKGASAPRPGARTRPQSQPTSRPPADPQKT
jgi:transcriptional regulator with XRE-family HTH domain